ncbi:hypothetical protein JCM10908_000033 [Rhodotorula pacifica]|uniref:uncharacterized protein n=1 Tax=Rhodotorula pacifica TaxID=1495444 RepID=UPI00316C9F38
MGRRKISIAPIKDERNRQVTFLKRKNGLFKKAYELGVLCSADVAIIVFNANGKLFEFHSGDMDQTLLRYSHYSGPSHEKRGPEDYLNQDLAAASTKRGSGLSDEGEDEEDSDEEKPHVAAGSSGVKVISSAAKGKQALRAAAERKSKLDDRSRSISEEQHPQHPQPQHQHHQQHGHSIGGPSEMFDHANTGADLAAVAAAAAAAAAAAQSSSGASTNGYPTLPPLNLGGFSFPTASMSAMATQQNGGFPHGFPSANPLAFPTFSTAPGGLPAPNFGFSLPGSVSWPSPFGTAPTSSSQQQPSSAFPNGSSGAPSTGGVPSWFGAPDPANSAAIQQARDQLAQLPPMQLLQQLGGMSAQLGAAGWPGLGNVTPEAAMQAIQQQAQQAQQIFQQHQQQQQYHHQQQQQQQPQQQHHHGPPQEPSPRSQPTPQPAPAHHSSPAFRPTPAPMYGTPVPTSMASLASAPHPQAHQQPTPASYSHPTGPGGHDITRPESSASIHSSSQHHSPAGGRPLSSVRQGSTDSLGYDRPRLQVAIPAEARANEHTKPGLVTAGGASMLGAGLGQRAPSHLREQPGVEEIAEEESGPGEGAGGGERSAFAADLLPSPFFPNASYSTGAAFAWPTSATGTDASPAGDTAAHSQPNGMQHAEEDAGHPDFETRRESAESAAEDNGASGLDDLSQAAQALSEGRNPGGRQVERTHLREDVEDVDAGPASARGKRRKV